MSKTSISSYNLRYLLWKEEKTNRSKWLDRIMNKLGYSKSKAKQLLLGDKLELEEQKKLAEAFGRSEEDFAASLFFDDKVDVISENISYLFESIEQKQLAKEIGVTKDAVSKWKNAKQGITKKNLAALLQYFRLPSETNLKTDPIFLSWTPIDDHRRREWINEQIREIDSDDLRDLFPAFERLLKD
jgi:transcriptional regulator with XRE-family HTH domain